MASIQENVTFRDYQKFIQDVYGIPNGRHFSTADMLFNIERFSRRGLKGIRKGDPQKTKVNCIISMSWFMSLLNQMQIDIGEELWKRFPYQCSYCASCPCVCKEEKITDRRALTVNDARRPKTIQEFQAMFKEIYPPEKRTIQHAGIHLAEEMGELSEMILAYRGAHEEIDFTNVMQEAADLTSCFMGVFNSLPIDFAKELSVHFHENCHKCHHIPCSCTFREVMSFRS